MRNANIVPKGRDYVTRYCDQREVCQNTRCSKLPLNKLPAGTTKDDVAYDDQEVCRRFVDGDGTKEKEIREVGIWK